MRSWGHRVKVKVIGGGSEKFHIPAMLNNDRQKVRLEDRAMTFACSMGFSDMADPLV